MERNPLYSPPYDQPRASAQAPSVAGHPATVATHSHPLDNKKAAQLGRKQICLQSIRR